MKGDYDNCKFKSDENACDEEFRKLVDRLWFSCSNKEKEAG